MTFVACHILMGTIPSRVKGGFQEMRTVVELTGVTARLLTDSNRPANNIMFIVNFEIIIHTHVLTLYQ